MNWFDEILHSIFKSMCISNAVVDNKVSCASLQCRKCGVIVGFSYFTEDGELHIHVCEGYKKYSQKISEILNKTENHPVHP